MIPGHEVPELGRLSAAGDLPLLVKPSRRLAHAPGGDRWFQFEFREF